MVDWYRKLNENKKGLFLLAVFDAFIFVCSLPLMFFHSDSGFWYGSIGMGWLLGSLAQLAGYWMIVTSSLLLTSKENVKQTGMALGAGGFFIRFLMYAIVLVLSAICTFKSEWFGGFNAFNFFSCFSALVIMSFFVLIFRFVALRKEMNEKKDSGASK